MSSKKSLKQDKYNFVVIGAGIAGLSFAHKISQENKSVLVLEKEDVVGGLARSLEYKGFYLDFCGHRFHTKNKSLLEDVLNLPDFTVNRHIKKSRIYMFDRYLDYPFKLESILVSMPLSQSIKSGIEFLYVQLRNKLSGGKAKFNSYKEWFIYYYGTGLYNVMCYPYTSKIWKTDPGKLSSVWATQRFKGEDMAKLIFRSIKKLLTLDFSDYTLEEDRLALDGGEFYYPNRGIQEMPG